MKNLNSGIMSLIILLHSSAIAQSTFAERQVITTDFFWRTPNNLDTADLDGDGDEDILAANYDGDRFKGNQLMWFENTDGAGTFGKAIYIQCENYQMMTAVHAADLDGDNDQDILACDDSENLAWFENTDGKGQFAAQRNFDLPTSHSNCIRTMDVDNDSDLDVIGISYWNEHLVFWYENLDGAGNFSAMKTLFSKTERSCAEDMTIADFDNDGDTDIVVSVTEGEISNIYCLKYIGNGNFSQANFVATSQVAYSIVSADLDCDHDMDIVTASANGLVWFENTDGQAPFSSAKRIAQVYSGTVFPEDLDNDGDMDLIFGNYLNRVLWFKNDGSGSFRQQPAITISNNEPGSFRTADFDNDGDNDILIGVGGPSLADSGSIVWYENSTNLTSVQENQSESPTGFQLFQNYPNPFNPSTTIHFSLQKSEYIALKIFNLSGQEVASLVNDVLSAGEHQVQWQADGLPTGIYLARLQIGSQIETKKLILQK